MSKNENNGNKSLGSSNNKENFFNDDSNDLNFSEILYIIRKRKRILFTVSGLIFTSLFSFTIFLRVFRPVYRGSFSLLISDPMDMQRNRRGMLQGVSMFEELAKNTTYNDIPTLIALLKSESLLKDVAQKHNLKARKLGRLITIKTGGQSGTRAPRYERADGILKVNVLTKKPKKGLALLHSLSDAYLSASLKQRQQRLNDGLEFLNTQQPLLEKKTNDLQREIVEFREKYSLIEPELEGITIKKQQESLDEQILRLKGEKDSLRSVRSKIEEGKLTAKGFKEAINNKSNLKDEGLTVIDFDQSLLSQLQTVEDELSKAKTKYIETSPIIVRLNNRLEEIKPTLLKSQLEAVDTAISLNQLKLESLMRQKQELENKFLQKPILIKEFNTLKQKLNISKSNLIGLVSARENFQLQIAQSTVPWKVIEEPRVRSKPVRPSVRRGFSLAVIYASFFGIVACFIRDRIDHTFDNAYEVENTLKLPILGFFPHVNKFKNLREDQNNTKVEKSELLDLTNTEMDKKERFYYQEALRSLYTSIRFLDSSSKIKILTISSSVPKEGKTLLNILTAQAISELGKRVILIDADLRKPRVHKILGIDNMRGLSNLLVDQNLIWEDISNSLKQYKNLKIITAGIIPPDPTRLLDSERMASLIKELRESDKVDYIIFDTSPILGIADASILAKQIDGTIMLVSINNVDRDLSKQSLKILNSINANILGAVTNQIKIRKTKNSKDSNSYGYGYGYGYTYDAYKEYYPEENENKKELIGEDVKKENNNILFAKVKDKFIRIIKWLDS